MLKRFSLTLSVAVLALAMSIPAWAQPNTPLYAAKKAYEAGHSIDAEAFLRYACVDGQEAQELRDYFAQQISELERQLGLSWNQVEFDFSGLTYELIERVGDQARVGISGTYEVGYPGGHEVDEDPDVIIVQLVEGRWLMCGDQDQASQPLSGTPNAATPPVGSPDNPLSVLPPPGGPMHPAAPGQGGMTGPSGQSGSQDMGMTGPVAVAKQAYESSHALDADGFIQAACVDEQTQVELRAEFLRLREDAAQTVGIQWSQVNIDFSQVQYQLLEQVGDQARVAVSGQYVITYPGGREVDQDPYTMLLQRDQDGRWLMCGDQDTADMPLSPYTSPNY